MATRLTDFIAKAAGDPMTADALATNGGLLSNEQARQFLRDAIEASVILKAADSFDSKSPKFDVPALAFGNRIMRATAAGMRVDAANRVAPTTGEVTLSTELFKGEVPIAQDVFEDNIEGAELANTIMQMIAEAVGRDLEEIAIKSDTTSTDPDFAKLAGGGIISQLITANENLYDATGKTSYKAMFKGMVGALPTRYRRDWSSFVLYVTPHVADGYADELGDRATQLGDANTDGKPVQRYRGIPVIEVPLLSGTDTWGATSHDFSTYAVLCNPKNLKIGFHRRVEVERYREPLSNATSFLPRVRYDARWAQVSSVVLGENVPAL
jgi:HK97 family phage major capsid protein